MPIQYSDDFAVLEALFNIRPGDVVHYGQCRLQTVTNSGRIRLNQRQPIIRKEVGSIPYQIEKLLIQLDRSHQVMLFQKRQNSELWCLAVGVMPYVRLNLERVGEKA